MPQQPDPVLGELPIGARIAHYRVKRGLSQLALGAMLRRSENWVWKVENGVIPIDRFSMLLELMRALGVRDLAELTGHHLALAPNATPEHDSAAAIRAAMTALPATRGMRLPGAPLTAEALAERVADAWAIYDHDKARYARLGPQLPDLLGEAHRTVRSTGEDALAATRSLIEVYHLLQVYLKRIGESETARLAADRAVALAAETGDLTLMGASAWNLGAILLNRGEGDLALELARDMIGMMTPIPDDASPEYISVYGALHLVAVIGCARSGKPREGWGFLGDAKAVAARLGDDRNDHRTSFGPTNVAMHAVHLAGEEGDAAKVLHLADDVDLSPSVLPLERKTRYLIEVMNANRMQRDDLGTLYMLKKIEDISPEEIKYFPMAREAARDLLKRERSIYKADLRALAGRIGVLA